MSEHIHVNSSTKEGKYLELIPQLRSLFEGEPDLIANMANCSAALKEAFGFLWIGFYLVKGEDLVLGPFQGPVACTRIGPGRGVCGASWVKASVVVVEDVEKFPGHIACSSLSKSEIVVPLIDEGRVWAVLDVDSERVGNFDGTDEKYLGQIAGLLKK